MATGTSSMVRQFVNGLKNRNEEVRLKAAYDLKLYMSTELKEALPDDITNFVEEFSHQILEMVQSQDVSEKKGGILAIGKCL
jgi:FKBP12-rapamycin complex-associated protein